MAFCRIVRLTRPSFHPVHYVDLQDQTFKTIGEKLESREDYFDIPLLFENLEAYPACLALEE